MQQDTAKSLAEGNAELFLNRPRFFIESVWTMAASASAAIASFEVEFFGENFVTFW